VTLPAFGPFQSLTINHRPLTVVGLGRTTVTVRQGGRRFQIRAVVATVNVRARKPYQPFDSGILGIAVQVCRRGGRFL
jgi:hypothetical protein